MPDDGVHIVEHRHPPGAQRSYRMRVDLAMCVTEEALHGASDPSGMVREALVGEVDSQLKRRMTPPDWPPPPFKKTRVVPDLVPERWDECPQCGGRSELYASRSGSSTRCRSCGWETRNYDNFNSTTWDGEMTAVGGAWEPTPSTPLERLDLDVDRVRRQV